MSVGFANTFGSRATYKASRGYPGQCPCVASALLLDSSHRLYL